MTPFDSLAPRNVKVSKFTIVVKW